MALNEGKSQLSERNKHILLAEKFGWDAVKCYTAKPLPLTLRMRNGSERQQKKVSGCVRKRKTKQCYQRVLLGHQVLSRKK